MKVRAGARALRRKPAPADGARVDEADVDEAGGDKNRPEDGALRREEQQTADGHGHADEPVDEQHGAPVRGEGHLVTPSGHLPTIRRCLCTPSSR